MDLTRKSVISAGCAIVLASGLFILLVLLIAPMVSDFSQILQKSIMVLIFLIIFILAIPFLFRRFNGLQDIRKVLGWTFMGLGVEFILFPILLLIFILNFTSLIGIIIGWSILIMSFIFSLPAGLISIGIGISLLRR